ncbi:hypothetical protein [Streptomyces ureilyticus]|uniref:Uncharacterized protein n=1 Tax=Streptomyces ureilyticus TaxID=1775131 RepID=A0ABX0DY65_9ACTN|nr:hypothetical protein [Streptomyces ureilyticus]NGO44899.1 hypothetical protein [Streptomyces ureilyticus]
MGNVGGGDRGDEAERVSRLVGELLIGLGEKVRAAGPEGVRVLTDEELQRQQLNWFRAGWHEHARATEPPDSEAHTGADARPEPGPTTRTDDGVRRQHPDSEHFPPPPARLLHFPERPPEGLPDDGQARS